MLISAGPFGGEVPRTSPDYLSSEVAQATIAENCVVNSGAVEAYGAASGSGPNAAAAYFHGDRTLTEAEDADFALISGGVAVCGEGTGGLQAYLGEAATRVPLKVDPPQAPVGLDALREIAGAGLRYYVATVVTDEGWESKPSPLSNGVYGYTGTAPPNGFQITDASGVRRTFPEADFRIKVSLPRPARGDCIALYRTAAGTGGSSFRFVRTFKGGASRWTDDVPDSELGAFLLTEDDDPPDASMKGIIYVTNGFFAGFGGADRDKLWFSQIAKPWAWPTLYEHNVGSPIVAIRTLNEAVVVLTEAAPWIFSGADPSRMIGAPLDSPYACSSRGSIVVLENSVIYASPSGLVKITPGTSVEPAMVDLIDWNRWKDSVDPSTLRAAWYRGNYVGSHSRGTFVLDLVSGRNTLTRVAINEREVVNASPISDFRTGALYLNGQQVDNRTGGRREVVRWRSKRYVAPKPVSWGVAQVIADYPEIEGTVRMKAQGGSAKAVLRVWGRLPDEADEGLGLIAEIGFNDTKARRIPQRGRYTNVVFEVRTRGTLRRVYIAELPSELPEDDRSVSTRPGLPALLSPGPSRGTFTARAEADDVVLKIASAGYSSSATIPPASASAAGVLTAALWSKLSSLRQVTGLAWASITGRPPLATQAEAEAGTEDAGRIFSPLRVAQAIAAKAVRTTWASITGKPDTAVRWPDWGEVGEKPATATRWPTFAEVTGTKPPANAQVNVQSDWDATSGDSYIRGKPTIPALPAEVTQAEAEAGTGTDPRLWTPERVAQAVAALAAVTASSTAVASQAALDAITTANRVAFALVTTAFGTWQVGDLLVYDHHDAAWERAVNLPSSVQAAVTNLGVTRTAGGFTITSSSGVDAVVPAADGTNAGAFTAALFNKLSGIDTGANANPAVVGKAEAEAGTATTARLWTALRVKEAIEALGDGAGSVDWADVTGKPTIPTLRTAQETYDLIESLLDYTDLQNKPSIPTLRSAAETYQLIRSLLNYNDLSNKPDIPAAVTSLGWDAITGKPTLAPANAEQNVNADWDATSGDALILNKPTIPSAQVPADWDATTGVARILNKPSIPVLPTAQQTYDLIKSLLSYSDLSNRPTIPAAQVPADWSASTGVARILNKPSIPVLRTAAQTYQLIRSLLNYNDLSNRPTIPAAQVPADWGAATGVARILNKPTIPVLRTAQQTYNLIKSLLSYNDLSDRPTIPPAVTSLPWGSITGKPALAPSNAEQNVNADWNATSGDAQILNKPSVPTLPATVSKAEAEAGTATTARLWTAERVKQAVAALETTTGSLTGVATQAALDGITTSNRIAMAIVTTAFGSWQVGDLLFYDHGDSAWERAVNLPSEVSAAATNLGITRTANAFTITSSSGVDAVVPVAGSGKPGGSHERRDGRQAGGHRQRSAGEPHCRASLQPDKEPAELRRPVEPTDDPACGHVAALGEHHGQALVRPGHRRAERPGGLERGQHEQRRLHPQQADDPRSGHLPRVGRHHRQAHLRPGQR